jgi:hypothetical protein
MVEQNFPPGDPLVEDSAAARLGDIFAARLGHMPD